MHYATKLLGSVAAATALIPLGTIPEFLGESRHLLSPALAQSAEDRQAEADRLLQQGVQQYNASRFQEALQSLQQALSIYREIGNLTGEARTLGSFGNAYLRSRNYQQAITFYEQSLAIFREIGDDFGEQFTLSNLDIVAGSLLEQGVEQYQGDQFPEAFNLLQQALLIYRETDNLAGQARTLGSFGNAYIRLRDYQQTITFYKQSLSIFREIGDGFGEQSTLRNLGVVADRLLEQGAEQFYISQYQEALQSLQLALAIYREIGSLANEGLALKNLGNVYLAQGNYQQAIDFYERSIKIAQETENRDGEIDALVNLGVAYSNLGDYQRAIGLFDQTLKFTRETGDLSRQMDSLNNLGVTYEVIGNYQQAINFSKQSLDIAREIGDRRGEGYALGNLGNAHRRLGNYQQAIDFYQQRLVIAQEIEDRLGESRGLGNLAIAYNRLGDYRQAINFYEQSLIIKREIGDRAGEALTYGNQGSALIDAGQISQAEATLHRSIEIFESLRIDLSDSQLISLADAQAIPYIHLERALIIQNKDTEALQITERGRGRAFLLQLARRPVSPEEQAAVEARSIDKTPAIADIQRIARDTNSTLVTYSQIFDLALYIWVVQPSGEIAFRSVEFEGSGNAGFAINPIADIDGPVYRSAADESELGQLVADSRASIAIESTNTRPEQLRDLHTLLIDPIADLLPTDPEAKVVFVPQGNLFLVPFAALQDSEGTYLIEKHTILTAPSIQVYGLANEAASSTTGANGHSPFSADNALVVGNPTMPKVWSPTASGNFAETQLTDLPGAKAEAEAIGGFLNITPLIGSQATEARVKQLLPSARLIHLATHGLLDYGDPRAYGRLDVPGAIALTPDSTEDGLLTSAEILEMDLQAELAVLSACDTGRGRITGDGVVGLSRSLITAGVPSVVVSLWAVPDAPTAELMTEFYRQLDQGQDKAQALRQAMLTTLEQHPNPRNWAAFTLIGAAE